MKFLAHQPGRTASRRALLQAVALGLLAPAFTPAHAQLALSTAINRTGRFRAMSQRIAKAYCQIHLNVLPEQARSVLTSSRQLVQSGFEDLSRVQWPAELGRLVTEVQKQFATLESAMVMPPTRESVAAVAAQSDKMLAAAQLATEAFEKAGKTGTARLVNLAGRQRALAQRLAKNYFLTAARLDGKAAQEQMKADAAEFRQSMATLVSAPVSTPAIRNELALGDSQWLFFDAALQRKVDDRGLEVVATTSERLLDVMDRLTSLYDAALKEVIG